jgi:hypothetical protein
MVMAYTFTIQVSDTEYKAFQLMAEDPDDWVDHAIRNKIRKLGIRLAELHASDPERWLTATDRQEIKAVMEANGDLMRSPANWSTQTLKAIVDRTTLPTMLERNAAEYEALAP